MALTYTSTMIDQQLPTFFKILPLSTMEMFIFVYLNEIKAIESTNFSVSLYINYKVIIHFCPIITKVIIKRHS